MDQYNLKLDQFLVQLWKKSLRSRQLVEKVVWFFFIFHVFHSIRLPYTWSTQNENGFSEFLCEICQVLEQFTFLFITVVWSIFSATFALTLIPKTIYLSLNYLFTKRCLSILKLVTALWKAVPLLACSSFLGKIIVQFVVIWENKLQKSLFVGDNKWIS